mgnify:CR=1 FL=1
MTGTTFSLVPTYLDLQGSEARRGTTYVRVVDRNWIVGWNRAKERYDIWGPTQSKAWDILMIVMDDRHRMRARRLRLRRL